MLKKKKEKEHDLFTIHQNVSTLPDNIKSTKQYGLKYTN